MKMHGLGDGPYWMISYMYFLTVSSIYMLCFVILGSLTGKYYNLENYITLASLPVALTKFLMSWFNKADCLAGLKIFTLNDYGIQFVFYFIYINLQISMAFLASTMFTNVKTSAGLTFFVCLLMEM